MFASEFVAGGVTPLYIPSDSADITPPAIGFRVRGTQGDVTIMQTDGVLKTIPACLVSEDFPIACKRIMSTGTTAVGIMLFRS